MSVKRKQYNWVCNVIREKKEPRTVKEQYVSPQRIKNGNQYKEKLLEWTDSLKREFRKSCNSRGYVKTIDEMRSSLEYILSQYYAGNIGNAYDKMKEIISLMMENSVGLAVSSIQKSFAFNDVKNVLDDNIQNTQIEFFRARVSEKYCVLDREEMLHVPFDMREKVSSTRFSIPGLPCLYLATTSYGCWIELGNPAEHQFNVSPVLVNQEKKILNLTMSSWLIEEIADLVENQKMAVEYMNEALKLWILSYASSFEIDNDNRIFKDEYIVPQLIMLVSKDLGLDGVSYYSKQVENDRFAYMISVNLALFAKYSGEKKFSEICKDIQIAPSYNYAMFKQLMHSEKYKIHNIELHISRSTHLKKIGGFNRQNEYQFTEFYNFDRYLFSHIKPEMQYVDIEKENR